MKFVNNMKKFAKGLKNLRLELKRDNECIKECLYVLNQLDKDEKVEIEYLFVHDDFRRIECTVEEAFKLIYKLNSPSITTFEQKHYNRSLYEMQCEFAQDLALWK